MKITSLKMSNYRQFFDEHIIKFSTDLDTTITVIHGENGSGKTSILNAFKWAFYGNTDFDTGNENIINEQSIARANDGEEVKMCIVIEFENEERIFTATRQQMYRKIGNVGDLEYESIGSSVFDLN